MKRISAAVTVALLMGACSTPGQQREGRQFSLDNFVESVVRHFLEPKETPATVMPVAARAEIAAMPIEKKQGSLTPEQAKKEPKEKPAPVVAKAEVTPPSSRVNPRRGLVEACQIQGKPFRGMLCEMDRIIKDGTRLSLNERNTMPIMFLIDDLCRQAYDGAGTVETLKEKHGRPAHFTVYTGGKRGDQWHYCAEDPKDVPVMAEKEGYSVRPDAPGTNGVSGPRIRDQANSYGTVTKRR